MAATEVERETEVTRDEVEHAARRFVAATRRLCGLLDGNGYAWARVVNGVVAAAGAAVLNWVNQEPDCLTGDDW